MIRRGRPPAIFHHVSEASHFLQGLPIRLRIGCIVSRTIDKNFLHPSADECREALMWHIGMPLIAEGAAAPYAHPQY